MKKKVLIVVILVIVLVAIGVGVYFGVNQKDNSSKNKKEVASSSNETEPIPEDVEEPVTYLEYPDKNEYERQILERYSNNNDFKVISVSGEKFKGYLVAIYEPERVHAVVTSKRGYSGEYVDQMVADNNGLVGINAGGFADADFNGDGSNPSGITITKNTMIERTRYGNSRGGIVGFDSNNRLILEDLDSDSVVSRGIRDCVSFSPFLVVNGETKSIPSGGGAFQSNGRTARSAIGQREDGIVLLLCVDGDRTKGEGAKLSEITEIMKNYGAVNVSDLDGGTSCQLVVGDRMINDPTSLNGEHRSRPVATAFILEKDDENNGDMTAVN